MGGTNSGLKGKAGVVATGAIAPKAKALVLDETGDFIGIEKDEGYFKIAKERIEKA